MPMKKKRSIIQPATIYQKIFLIFPSTEKAPQTTEGVSFSVAPNCRIQVDVDPERYDVVKDEMDGSAAIIIKMNARVGGCTAVFAVDFQE